MDANVVRADGLMALPLVEVVWEDDAFYQIDDFLYLFSEASVCGIIRVSCSVWRES